MLCFSIDLYREKAKGRGRPCLPPPKHHRVSHPLLSSSFFLSSFSIFFSLAFLALSSPLVLSSRVVLIGRAQRFTLPPPSLTRSLFSSSLRFSAFLLLLPCWSSLLSPEERKERDEDERFLFIILAFSGREGEFKKEEEQREAREVREMKDRC